MKKDIVCGMTLSSTYGCEFSKYNDEIYYFCSAECKKEFEEDPREFIDKYLSDNLNRLRKENVEWERDPVCGEMIKVSEAKAMSIYKKTKYYFCCPICKKEFDKNPSGYADREEGHYDPNNPNDFIDGKFGIL